MATTFGKAQKVTAAVQGANDTTPNCPITGLTAVSADPAIFIVAAVDQSANTVEIHGVADGVATITYTALNNVGGTVTVTDTITIADAPPPPQLTATTLTITYSAPVAQ